MCGVNGNRSLVFLTAMFRLQKYIYTVNVDEKTEIAADLFDDIIM